MSVRMRQSVDPKFVNRLLANNFDIMERMGPRTMMPFLQEVIRVDGLVGSLARSFVSDPTLMPQNCASRWSPITGRLAGTCWYDDSLPLHWLTWLCFNGMERTFVDKLDNPQDQFQWRTRLEIW